jgi:glucosylceramidase
MKHSWFLLVCLIASFVVYKNNHLTQFGEDSFYSRLKQTHGEGPEFWLTRGDRKALLKREKFPQVHSATDLKSSPLMKITIRAESKYQSLDGFGFALTGGSAELINALPESAQDELLKELFTTDGNGIGVSYLRVSMGASDLSREVFTYHDTKDENLKDFSLSKDLDHLVPVLQKIIKLQPQIKILASPWTAPSWMKTSKSSIAGKLEPKYESLYAQYFLKYIKAMADKGINIQAVTLQNEPLNPENNPSMLMQALDQANFVKNHLGPLFEKENIKTKIIIWDHNCDLPDYPITVLKDDAAKAYIDGSAFHLYAGDVSCLSKVHQAFPSKNVYLTEQWVGGPSNFNGDLLWHIKNMVIGGPRNWSRTVIEWNLAATSQYLPHTPGGCKNCLGALSIDYDPVKKSSVPPAVLRNVAYYVIGHVSKFVSPGAFRVESESSQNELSHVAFENKDGKIVFIVLNEKTEEKEFLVEFKKKVKKLVLPPQSVGTFIWKNW